MFYNTFAWSVLFLFVLLCYNVSGIAEGRDLEAESFNLAQMLNRITKY